MPIISDPGDLLYKMHIAPLEETIQRPNFALEASAQVAVDQIKISNNLNNTQSASLHSSLAKHPLSSSSTPALPVTPKCPQNQPITPIAPARHGNSRDNVRELMSIQRGSEITSKPIRPLASFFNEFIQNIRNAAVSQDQPPVSDKHLVSKRRLRQASRNSGPSDKPSTSVQPILTGTTEGIFASQQPWTNELESICQNDQNYRDHMNMQRTPNQCLSPDILAILEPQNYQVILSSPS